jgi:hypothetical protein
LDAWKIWMRDGSVRRENFFENDSGSIVKERVVWGEGGSGHTSSDRAARSRRALFPSITVIVRASPKTFYRAYKRRKPPRFGTWRLSGKSPENTA